MIGNILYYLYITVKLKKIKKILFSLIYKLEGGYIYSKTLRKIMKNLHKVDIGMYTLGGCFYPGQFDKFTTIGRYCSIAITATAFNRNHPIEYKSTHGFFFNSLLKFIKKDTIEYIPLEIGNDVWLGHNSIIMPHVRFIGDGAVISAGAVVNKDVAPYSVMVGNPARVVRFRFPKDVIEKLLEEKWWEKSIEEIENSDFEEYTKPFVEKNEEEENE